jgi:hypothetical protein
MENWINWLDVNNGKGRGGGCQIKDLGIRTYCNYKLNNNGDKKIASNAYIVLSDFLNELYGNYTFIKVGLLNKKVVIKFNNEDGLKIIKNSPKIKKEFSRVNSLELCKLIASSFNLPHEDFIQNLELTDLGSDTFLINSISK